MGDVFRIAALAFLSTLEDVKARVNSVLSLIVMVMALLLAIRDAKLPMPSGAFLISPWVDLHCEADSYIREADRDVVLSRPVMRQAAA